MNRLLLNKYTEGFLSRIYRMLREADTRIQFRRIRRGKNVVVYPGLVTARPENIEIGDNVSINHNAVLYAHDNSSIKIGDYTAIGPGVMIFTVNHDTRVTGCKFADAHIEGDVIVGRNVWIGAGAILLPGIRIGEGAVVAAGSVVSRDVEPFSVVGGVPAAFISPRKK